MLASTFMRRGRRLGYGFQRTKTFSLDKCAEWNVYRIKDNKPAGILNKPKRLGQCYYEPSGTDDNSLIDLYCERSRFRAMLSGLFHGH